MSEQQFYPIGTPGQPWGDAEKAEWLAQQRKQRSYADEVVTRIQALGDRFDLSTYAELDYAPEHYALYMLQSRNPAPNLPTMLITGGVHGYETSGVHGALLFAEQHAEQYAGRANLIILPCHSPWAYERIHRWDPYAIDPNRNFFAGSPAPEAQAFVDLIARLATPVAMHIDLHETTDTDESVFRPALAARDGEPYEPGEIPDGFYLCADREHPAPAFQTYINNAVAAVTHIAPADANGEIIGSPVVAPGVIEYPLRKWGLCAGVSNAPLRTTTEVYPDSPRATPDICNQAQVAAVVAAIDYALDHPH